MLFGRMPGKHFLLRGSSGENDLTSRVLWGILRIRQIRIRRKERELWQKKF